MPSLLDACEAAIQASAEPLPLAKLAPRALAQRSVKPAQREQLRPVLRELVEAGRAFEWPGTAREPRYWHRDVVSTIDAALRAVAVAPGTPKSMAASLRGKIPKLPAALLARHISDLLKRWAAAGELRTFAVSRSNIVYLPIERDPLGHAILEAVATLEPGPHNYVTVRQIRESDPVKRVFDGAVLALAAAGALAVGPFDGALPIPREQRLDVVESSGQPAEAYIAVARRE